MRGSQPRAAFLRNRPVIAPWIASALNLCCPHHHQTPPPPNPPNPPHPNPNPRPPALQVKGKRLDTDGGIRTRARAAARAEQWSAVPLRVRLIMLLTDAYIEATAQGGLAACTASGGKLCVCACVCMCLEPRAAPPVPASRLPRR
jgi:hypothetical protein